MDSSEFMSWGSHGTGHWITVYTNPGHAYVEIAGIRFDTSSEGDPHPAPGSGPHWRPLMKSHGGFAARHPERVLERGGLRPLFGRRRVAASASRG